MQVYPNQKWGLFKDRDLKQNYRHPWFRMNTKPDPRDQFSGFPADNEVHGFHYGGKLGVPPNHPTFDNFSVETYGFGHPPL